MNGTVAGVSSARESAARAALDGIAAAGDIGQLVGEERGDDGAWTLQFQARMLGYPGWRWTVSLVELDGEPPSVLEAELLPGPGALVAPEWVPWSVRLEEYQAHLAAQAAERAAAGLDADAASDADDDGDASDDDDLLDEDEVDDELDDELDDDEDGSDEDDEGDDDLLDDFDEDDLDIERDDHGIDLGDDEGPEGDSR